MTLSIHIETVNAAFDDNQQGPELARILRGIADRLENLAPSDCADWTIYDINGNRVGRLYLDDEESES